MRSAPRTDKTSVWRQEKEWRELPEPQTRRVTVRLGLTIGSMHSSDDQGELSLVKDHGTLPCACTVQCCTGHR